MATPTDDAEQIFCARVRELVPEGQAKRIAEAATERGIAINANTLRAVARGDRVPNVALAHRIAQALNVSLDELLAPTAAAVAVNEPEERYGDEEPDNRVLLRKIDALERKVDQFIKAVAPKRRTKKTD